MPLLKSNPCCLIRLIFIGGLVEVVNLQPFHTWSTIALDLIENCWVEVTAVTEKLKFSVIMLLCFCFWRERRTFYSSATFTFRNSNGKSPCVTSSIKLVCFLLAVFREETGSQTVSPYPAFQSLIWNDIYKL